MVKTRNGFGNVFSHDMGRLIGLLSTAKDVIYENGGISVTIDTHSRSPLFFIDFHGTIDRYGQNLGEGSGQKRGNRDAPEINRI